MLSDAINTLATLGTKANGIEVHDLDFRRKLIRTGDRYEQFRVSPPVRSYTVLDFNSFVSVVRAVAIDTQAIVFVNADGAYCYFDELERSDHVRLPFVRSRAYDAMLALGEKRDQRTVITMLREQLANCIDPGFLSIVRRLDFKRRNDGANNLQHGRESLGKSVEQVVQSEQGEIPEYITASFPLWNVRGFASTVTVGYAVSIDIAVEQLSLKPVGEQLVNAIAEATELFAVSLLNAFTESANNEPVPLVLVGNPGGKP